MPAATFENQTENAQLLGAVLRALRGVVAPIEKQVCVGGHLRVSVCFVTPRVFAQPMAILLPDNLTVRNIIRTISILFGGLGCLKK